MSYSDVSGHRSMVFDGVRNAAYSRALTSAIRPGFTAVMDLGAGLGVHGLNAAKLGAAAVHLVEPAPVLEVARNVAADNGLTNMHFHRCRVEELKLDTRVDVLVSVFTGNFLLSEDLLPALFFARDKFLAPGGTMIPDRARMEVVPVSAPDYYRKHIDAWHSYPEYAAEHRIPELDYKTVRAYAANTIYYDVRKKFSANPLAAPAALMEMDFTTATSAKCDSKVAICVEQDGTCHGWLGWFQMRLGDDWLTTSGEPEQTHWSQVFLPLATPLQVKAGDQLQFALNRPEHGHWTWTTVHGNHRQRQSTFLAQPPALDQLRKSADSFRPARSQRGEAARWLLAQMAGAYSLVDLSTRALDQFPWLFANSSEALRFVKDLARRFSQ